MTVFLITFIFLITYPLQYNDNNSILSEQLTDKLYHNYYLTGVLSKMLALPLIIGN